MIFFIRSVPITIPPSTGTAPPVYPTPPPRAVTGKRAVFASFRIATICPVDSGNTTASGGNFSFTASAAYGSTFSGSTTTFSSPTISRNFASTSGLEAFVVARPFDSKWMDWNIANQHSSFDPRKSEECLSDAEDAVGLLVARPHQLLHQSIHLRSEGGTVREQVPDVSA